MVAIFFYARSSLRTCICARKATLVESRIAIFLQRTCILNNRQLNMTSFSPPSCVKIVCCSERLIAPTIMCQKICFVPAMLTLDQSFHGSSHVAIIMESALLSPSAGSGDPVRRLFVANQGDYRTTSSELRASSGRYRSDLQTK